MAGIHLILNPDLNLNAVKETFDTLL